MTARVLLVALAAFLLGTLAGPWLPYASERRTLTLTGASNDQARIRAAAGDGWTVQRVDLLDHVGYLVTVERPRALGLYQSLTGR